MPNITMPEGVSPTDLHTVMLAISPQEILKYVGEDAENDLYFSKIDRLWFAQGAVGEKNAHITLLGGIHPMVSLHEYTSAVGAVLRDWKPEPIQVDSVGFFPSTVDGEDYRVIVSNVHPSNNILEAHARLSVLNHTSRFDEYKPHITLAYINGSADLDKWLVNLDAVYGGQNFEPVGLDLGIV